MDFAADQPAIGVHDRVDIEAGSGEKQHMHALAAVDGGDGFAHGEDLTEAEGVEGLAAPVVVHLGREVGLAAPSECQDPELPVLIGIPNQDKLRDAVEASEP